MSNKSYSREYKKFLKLKEAAVRMMVLKGAPLDEARDKIDYLLKHYNNDYVEVTKAIKDFFNL